MSISSPQYTHHNNYGVINMALTEAQATANKKYLQKFDDIKLRVPKGRREQLHEHAASCGESLNEFITRAINETIERDQKIKFPKK